MLRERRRRKGEVHSLGPGIPGKKSLLPAAAVQQGDAAAAAAQDHFTCFMQAH